MVYEFTILSIFWVELVMQFVHLYYDFTREARDKYLSNKKFLFKILILFVLSIDSCYFYQF